MKFRRHLATGCDLVLFNPSLPDSLLPTADGCTPLFPTADGLQPSGSQPQDIVATWKMPQRPFDSRLPPTSFFDTTYRLKQYTPHMWSCFKGIEVDASHAKLFFHLLTRCHCNQRRLCPHNHWLWWGCSSFEIRASSIIFYVVLLSCLTLGSSDCKVMLNFSYVSKSLPIRYREVRSCMWAWLKFQVRGQNCPQFQQKSVPV